MSRTMCVLWLAVLVGLAAASLGQAAEPAPGAVKHQLAFVLSDEHGFRIDSRAGLVTKDMVVGPDTTIALALTEEDLQALAALMRQRHLLLVAQPRPPERWNESFDPSWTDTLDVTLDGGHGRWMWQEPRLRPGAPAEWQSLFAVVDSIYRLVTGKEAYRKLPPIRGAYL